MRAAVIRTIENVRAFVPRAQLAMMADGLRGEERAFFRDSFRALESTIASMPVTYEQSELGEAAVVHLHYFAGSCDWWVTEKDMEGETPQAFGLVDLGHGPELGYISIDELVSVRGMNIDLHWQPCTLAELKAKKYPEDLPEPEAPPAVPTVPTYTMAMIVDPVACMATAPANGVWH